MIKLLTHWKNRNFQRLWLAQLISQFGDRIHQLALIALIAERSPGSAMDLAKLIAFTILPVFLIQPFAGVLVDRWDRRTTLFICDIFRGLVVLTIPFLFIYKESMIPIYFIVFLAFSFSRFYLPAKMSIIPDIVEEDYLLMANSLITTTGMIAVALGGAIGGFLIEAVGARDGFLIDAGTFFASGVIIYGIKMPEQLKIYKGHILEKKDEIVAALKGSFWQEFKEGCRYIYEHKEIRFIMQIVFVLMAAAGSIYVILVIFVQEVFESVTKDIGILAISLVIGLFCGVVLYGKWGRRLVWYNTIFFCLILGSALLSIMAYIIHATSNIWIAMGLSCVWGLVIGPIIVAANTVIQLVSDEKKRGQVFSALEIVIHLAFLIAMFLTSWISQYVANVWILVTVGIITFVISLGYFAAVHYNKDLARLR